MHITKVQKNPNLVELTITANEADLSPVKANTLKKLAPNVKLAGFREGKVPLNMVEKNLDQAAFQSEFLDMAVNALYNQALTQEDLRPVANPEMNLSKFVPFTLLEFTLTVPVIGTIKLGDYKSIKMKKTPVTIEAKQVNEVVASLQKRMAERAPVIRAAKDGDEVMLDFKGTDEKGEAVGGAEGKDYPLALGSNTFIPGFEENVVGLKPTETKTFTIPFPKDYGVKALQGKKVTFEITVNSVNELVEPKLDDDFAAKAGPFKTLAELKEDIKKQLLVEREQEAERNYEEALLQEIAKKSKISVPKELVDEQIERIENEEKQNLVYRGQTWEEHLKAEGVTADEHKEQKRGAATSRVEIGILLSEIAEAEKITVEPKEFDARIKAMKAQYQDAAAQSELDKPEVQRDILARMITEKTINKLVGYATK
ncbi:MAG: Trigger factor [Candidatus Saccharibacteria bacterium]|nr:Trigger factor [Candidatus Saccharibacteria bacterium]